MSLKDIFDAIVNFQIPFGEIGIFVLSLAKIFLFVLPVSLLLGLLYIICDKLRIRWSVPKPLSEEQASALSNFQLGLRLRRLGYLFDSSGLNFTLDHGYGLKVLGYQRINEEFGTEKDIRNDRHRMEVFRPISDKEFEGLVVVLMEHRHRLNNGTWRKKRSSRNED